MKKSNFQFSNPHIEKIDFRVNNINKDVENLPININIHTEKSNKKREAIVKLTLIVGELGDDSKQISYPLYFNGVIAAEFKWDEDIDNIEDLLKINGGTVLLSYIRPILASLTMQAGIKPLNLPFINFMQ